MASDIVSEAREIARLVASLRQKANAQNGADLVQRATALRNTLNRVLLPKRAKALKNTNLGDRTRRGQALAQIEPLAAELPAKTSEKKQGKVDGEPKEMGIESFFEDVSRSLVNTQKRLNEVSLDYVRDLDPRIAPAYFAIPSLKAELKAGFQSTDGKKLGLVLFSSKKERKEYGESTVSFELAAAPPPPGEAPFGELSVQTPRYQTLGQGRRRLLAEARKIAQDQGTKLGKVFDNTEDSGLALVLRSEPTEEDRAAKRERYLVVWPARSAATKNQHLWQEIVVLSLVEDGDGVRLDPQSRLDSQSRPIAGKVLRIVRNDTAAPGDPAGVANELGHALNRIALAIRDGSPPKRLTDALP